MVHQIEFGQILHSGLNHAQEFERWKQTPGGRAILERCFRRAAPYASRYRKHGIKVSFKLIWEQVRDELRAARIWSLNRGHKRISLSQKDGYSLPNDMHAYVSRFILERRPEWAGMFETRELGSRQPKKRIIVEQYK